MVTAEQAGEKTVKAMAILMEARIDYICASIKMQAQYWGGKIGDLVEDVENKRKRGDRRLATCFSTQPIVGGAEAGRVLCAAREEGLERGRELAQGDAHFSAPEGIRHVVRSVLARYAAAGPQPALSDAAEAAVVTVRVVDDAEAVVTDGVESVDGRGVVILQDAHRCVHIEAAACAECGVVHLDRVERRTAKLLQELGALPNSASDPVSAPLL